MLTIPSYIEKVTTLKDKSLKIQVLTQELSAELMKQVFDYYETPGWFVFHTKPEIEFNTNDLPELKIEKDFKSPSQRLREIMFVYYKQKVDPKKISFDEFYRLEMEKLINYYKEKLD